MITEKAYDETLKKCEDLTFLNKYHIFSRETEYRILLILCGHTRHGKKYSHDITEVLKEYFNQYGNDTHVKNIHFLIEAALKKIIYSEAFNCL